MQISLESVLNRLEALLNKAKEDDDILALILFGSAAKGETTVASDINICLVLKEKADALKAFSKRMEYLRFGRVDVHIFQQLPLYIRRRVLKEGKVLFVRDEDASWPFERRRPLKISNTSIMDT
jgi:predicted nucleotidyltransferase